MELTVLGASGSYPSAHSACSGYLLQDEGYWIWMDAGNGTLKELQRHVALQDVNAIVLSHVHPDHCADLYPFFFGILFAELPQPIPVLTPPGVRETLESLIGAGSIESFRRLLDWQEATPGDRVDLGPFRIEIHEAAHSAVNNTMRIGANGKTLCYSGDTGPTPHLARAAADADVFLCESSWTNEQKGIMDPIHLTAREAGEAAAAAGAGQLVLTHIWPENDLGIIGEQASAVWSGPLSFAVETEGIEL